MIERFYTTTITIKRMVYASGKATESTIGTFSGHIQQAAAELIANLANSYTLSHLVWCDEGTNVQAGDTLTEGSNSYSVRAVRSYLVGSNQHLELHIDKHK